ncbi:unnamed protein product [marine sediment metagenome]|uniref:Uncharacterized protein n=1 Tax=marine sediment metagenome TaxID=412755 RepID=X0S5G7_9ZZZZ
MNGSDIYKISYLLEIMIQIGIDSNTKEGEEMQNVEWEIKGDKLIIEIDLTKEFGPSKSGKTITIASTRGNQQVEGTDAIIGLNVYKYPESV